jgi:hypothetical protein
MVNTSKLQIPEHRLYNWMCFDTCSLSEFLFVHGETASIKTDYFSLFASKIKNQNNAHLRGKINASTCTRIRTTTTTDLLIDRSIDRSNDNKLMVSK